ncbi:GAP family protein [Microbacterium sp. 3J1]|uniref:GAP family protein n=1 Tax=Microbacterium sp. 3J1 TaxID=861269 RepID=UPI000AB79262|nr:GAP family protein [Microbacterium sp. 3J1]
MIPTVWQLVPVALGVMASPVAVMALIGILLSRDARRIGTAYLLGWVLCSSVLTVVSVIGFRAAGASGAYRQAEWVPIVHAVVGVVCVGGAVWTFARSRRVVAEVAGAHTPGEVVHAAPQLPGIVRSVEGYTPRRAFLLGLAIFLSPMNIALVAAAGIEIVIADLPPRQAVPTMIGFVVASAAPVAIPVFTVLARGDGADPLLTRLRSWMLRHNGYLSAGIFAAVGMLQLFRAVQGWLA